METIFTVDYFIKKFEAIPEVEIGRGCLSKHCGMWHCGVVAATGDEYVLTAEAEALANILKMGDCFELPTNKIIYYTNDGLRGQYQQPTPKQRILAALNDIKNMQSKEQKAQECDATPVEKSVEAGNKKEIIRYVSVSQKIKEDKEELILN